MLAGRFDLVVTKAFQLQCAMILLCGSQATVQKNKMKSVGRKVEYVGDTGVELRRGGGGVPGGRGAAAGGGGPVSRRLDFSLPPGYTKTILIQCIFPPKEARYAHHPGI